MPSKLTDKQFEASKGNRAELHSAYAFIRGQDVSTSISALTLDHMLQEQIDVLDKGAKRSVLIGAGDSADVDRISRWNMVDNLKTNVLKVIKDIRDAGGDKDKLADLGVVEKTL